MILEDWPHVVKDFYADSIKNIKGSVPTPLIGYWHSIARDLKGWQADYFDEITSQFRMSKDAMEHYRTDVPQRLEFEKQRLAMKIGETMMIRGNIYFKEYYTDWGDLIIEAKVLAMKPDKPFVPLDQIQP